MLRSLAVFNSNSINKYGIAFTVEALESGLEQSWDVGMPSFVSHDYHRPIAWTMGLSLFIEPGLVRLTGVVLKPESREESDEIYRAVQHYLSYKTLKDFEQHKDNLTSRLNGFLSDNAQPHMPSCAAFIDDQLAVKCFPGLFSNRDEDGLIPLSLLTELAPGIFEKDGLLLFAHPYFRRSLSRLNSINTQFYESLTESSTSKAVDIRIALDTDMIGLAASYVSHIELEYWWGPKFDDDFNKIEPGVTRYNASDDERLFHGISQTEFWWHMQDKKKTLECEELRDIPSYGAGIDSYGCRYVHSIIDSDTAQPFHLDGAIRLYNEESMVERIDKDMKEAGRHTEYTKLWRIDGDLQVNSWKKLITHYFRDNPLVGEYLGAVEDNVLTPHVVSEPQPASPMSSYIPCDCKIGDGLMISVSYQPMIECKSSTRFVECFDTLCRDTTEYRYVESDFVEIIKILRKRGEHIAVPNGTAYVAFEDKLINFPMIQHAGKSALDLANSTHDTIKMLCEQWAKNGENRVVTYNIGIQYSHKNIYFSIGGHVVDLYKWHKQAYSHFPTNEKQIGVWCSDVEKYLSTNYLMKDKIIPLFDVLKKTGLIVLNRKYVDPENYTMRFDAEKNILFCDLKVKKKDIELIELLRQGKLATAYANLVIASKCTACNGSYLACNCSKYLDTDVCQEMTDFKLLAPFWTNRKA